MQRQSAETVAGQAVLLLERFDRKRTPEGDLRHRMASGLSALGAEDTHGDRGTWSDLLLADELRHRSAHPARDPDQRFRRMAFNALISNTDDDPRNHALLATTERWKEGRSHTLVFAAHDVVRDHQGNPNGGWIGRLRHHVDRERPHIEGDVVSLDLTPLRNAVSRLREGIARYESDVGDTQIRDGLIQRFEFTYEIAHRMLKRHLEQGAADPQAYDTADFAYLIRSGNEQGVLLSDWPAWRRFRELRGKTSHSYNERAALEVTAAIPAFLDEAAHLLARLQERHAE